jgi:hypothetical protein
LNIILNLLGHAPRGAGASGFPLQVRPTRNSTRFGLFISIPCPLTHAKRAFVISSLLFILKFQSFGQIITISKGISSRELKGDYSIVWTSATKEANGENLFLKSRNRFDYHVFSIANGIGYVDRVIAKGKYKQIGDTLKIKVTSKSPAPTEFLSLKAKYIITKIEDKGKKWICLIPLNKIDSIQGTLNKFPIQETEITLWNERIFANEITSKQ